MGNLDEIKNRFMKDNLAIRLGGLASNLARIRSFAQKSNNQKIVRDLIEESKFFIEWTAPEASLPIQEDLVNLQIQLALRTYSEDTKELSEFAEVWSEKILKLSGLLR